MKVRRPSSRRPSRGRASGVCRRSTPSSSAAGRGAGARGHALCSALGAGASTVASRVRYLLANDGQDTRAIQHYLGHKNITHTARYTNLAPDRFKNVPARLRIEARGHLSRYDADLARSSILAHHESVELRASAGGVGSRPGQNGSMPGLQRRRFGDASPIEIVDPGATAALGSYRAGSSRSFCTNSCGNGFIAPLQRFGVDIGDPRGPGNCLRSRRIAPAQSLHSAPSL